MNSPTTVGLAALIIGLGGGYFFATFQFPAAPVHVMNGDSSMSGAMASMTASLEGRTGAAFDRAFIEGMIVHHEGAVAMAEQALQRAEHEELKQMANEIISAQTREIATMQGWLEAWYGVSSHTQSEAENH